jgi:hypothetical protein
MVKLVMYIFAPMDIPVSLFLNETLFLGGFANQRDVRIMEKWPE